LLGLFLILFYGGFLLPIPSFAFGIRELLKKKPEPTPSLWRRHVTRIALALLFLGLAFWVYAILRDWTGHDVLYDGLTGKVGRFGSLALIILCGFSESRVRTYLLLGAIGLFLYFSVTIGEAI